MRMIAQEQAQLAAAQSMTEVLGASYRAFEQLLAAIRAHEDQAGSLFAAFVLAAASTADGRDALLAAPSLTSSLPAAPVPPTTGTGIGGPAGPAPAPARLADIDEIADALADLSQIIAATLARSARRAIDPADQAACAEASECAKAVWSLLARPAP